MKEIFFIATVYWAIPAQTNENPTITASGYEIQDIHNPKNIVAVPQNWITNNIVQFGDTIEVICDCPLDGLWVIEDVMNSRYNYCNKLDFLMCPGTMGKYRIKINLLN